MPTLSRVCTMTGCQRRHPKSNDCWRCQAHTLARHLRLPTQTTDIVRTAPSNLYTCAPWGAQSTHTPENGRELHTHTRPPGISKAQVNACKVAIMGNQTHNDNEANKVGKDPHANTQSKCAGSVPRQTHGFEPWSSAATTAPSNGCACHGCI